jgi:acetolactate synthase-1/2/3 large subunit
VVALLANGQKTGLLLGSHALYGDGLDLAGRIAAKTGADLLGETTPSRLARGEGRVAVEKIPYLPEEAIPFLQKYAQLILVGALFPVTTFAYKGKLVIKVPADCQVTTLATVDHDILSALGDLAKAVGAPSQPAARRERSKGVPPAGVLTDDAEGQSIGLLLPENAILVSDSPTMEGAFYRGTEGARAHDYCSRIVAGPSVGDFQWGWEPRWRARIGRPLFSKATAAACIHPRRCGPWRGRRPMSPLS